MEDRETIIASADGFEFDAVDVDGQTVGIQDRPFNSQASPSSPYAVPFIETSFKGRGNIEMHLICTIGTTSFLLERTNCTTSAASKSRARRELGKYVEKWLPFAARTAEAYYAERQRIIEKNKGVSHGKASRERHWYEVNKGGHKAAMPLTDAQLNARARQSAWAYLENYAMEREHRKAMRAEAEQKRRDADPCPDRTGEDREIYISALREVVGRHEAGEGGGTVQLARDVMDERDLSYDPTRMGRKAVGVTRGDVKLPALA